VPLIAVNGVRLYYESHGSGAPLVVQGGLGLDVLRRHHRQPRHAIRAQFEATTRFDCTSRLGHISAPALILHGKSDHIAPVALAEQTTALIPHCRLVLTDGGRLAPLLTQHRRLVSEIGASLAAG